MNTNTLWAIVGLIIIIGGGFWLITNSKTAVPVADDLGTYAYVCDNGSEFTMAPASDVASIRLTPGTGATFSTATLAKVESTAGARFEGGGVVFIGAGEGVQLTTGGATFVCNPKPNPDSPPWNWGDAGEGGGVKQDAVLIVSESIVGKWQSVDDTKFTREFKAGGVVEDRYENKVVSSGLWVAFEKGINAPEVPYPLEGDVVYIQMTMSGTQADTLNFKLTKLTPEELELIYMDRGGVLKFKLVQ
ncbi:MAG: hypothetical protein AAB665_02320 [Patescibacteria group bacterium]